MDWRTYRSLPESARQPPAHPPPPLPSERLPPLVSRWSPSSSEETLSTPPLDESDPWPRDDRDENIVIPEEEAHMSPAMRAARSLQRATGTLVRVIWRQLNNAFDLAARVRRETRMRALGWRRLPDEERQSRNVESFFGFYADDDGLTGVDTAKKRQSSSKMPEKHETSDID